MVDSSEDEGSLLRGNRFAVLGTHGELPDRPRRRLVLVSQQDDHGVDHEWDSDTDTVGGGSDVDAVDLSDLFERRAKVMRSVLHVLKGAFQMALRVACQEILERMEANSEVRVVRGWKVFLVLPRMMLFRPSRGVRQFQEGDWISLLRESVAVFDAAAAAQTRRQSEQQALSLWCRWRSFLRHAKPWKEHRWHLGILPLWGCSQTRQGEPLWRGGLSVLRFPTKPFILDLVEFLTCLRKSRRGAAAGPSGMTSDHLFPVLENEGT